MSTNINKDKAVRAVMTGKAGEHAVAARLLLFAMPVWFPGCDTGIDLMTENGCRIQVKSAHMFAGEDRYTRGIYFYPLRREKRRSITNSVTRMAVLPPFSETCDIVVLWGVDENRYWIVPSALLDGATGLGLGAPPKARFTGDISDMQEMRKLGYSDYKIGKHHGLQPQQIKQLLIDPSRQFVEETLVAKVRQCENAWEHILDFKMVVSNKDSHILFAKEII